MNNLKSFRFNVFSLMLVILSLIILACRVGSFGGSETSGSPAEDIIGKWQHTTEDTTMEFFKDGSCIETEQGIKYKSKYVILNDGKRLKIEGLPTVEFDFVIQGDTMTWNMGGLEVVYKKIGGESEQAKSPTTPAQNLEAEGVSPTTPAQNIEVATSPTPESVPTLPDATAEVKFAVVGYGLDGKTNVLESGQFISFGSNQVTTMTVSAPHLSEPIILEQYPHLPAGKYQLRVERPPYLPVEQEITLSPENVPALSGEQPVEVFLTMAPLDTTNLILLNNVFVDYQTGEVILNLDNKKAVGAIFGLQAKSPLKLITAQDAANTTIYQQAYLDGLPGEPFSFADGQPQPQYLNFSPDLKRAIYVQNNDLWLTEVDWSATKLLNPRQITQVGLWQSSIGEAIIWHPNGKHILVNRDEGLRVDMESGEVNEAGVSWNRLIERRLSPDSSMIVGRDARQSPYLYDIATNTKTPITQIERAGDFCWLDANRVAILGNNKIWVVNRDGSEAKQVAESKSNEFLNCSSKYVVTDRANVINVETGMELALPSGTRTDKIVWSNIDTVILNRMKGGEAKLEDQGIWLFKVSDGDLVKISQFPYESILMLPDKNMAVFIANDNLWRVNLDGSELIQLTDTGNVRGDLKPLKSFDF